MWRKGIIKARSLLAFKISQYVIWHMDSWTLNVRGGLLVALDCMFTSLNKSLVKCHNYYMYVYCIHIVLGMDSYLISWLLDLSQFNTV